MYYSQRHNCVVYEHADPAHVCAQISTARPVNGSYVAVPFDMHSMQLAQWIGLDAISPIDTQYDWPGQYTPKSHQRAMASFLTLNPRGMNLSAMRTGKTLAALWAADFLMDQGLVNRALVVCTLTNIERVWDKEIFRHFLGKRTAISLYGDRAQRLEALKRDADFYIINHDGLKIGTHKVGGRMVLGALATELAARDDINLVIVDEASAFKHASTQRSKVIKRIIHSKPYVWPLTGTPTSTGPTDAWGIKKLVADNIPSFMAFREQTMLRITNFKWIPKREAPEIVAKFLQPAIRFSREDCIDIPPISIEPRECALSPKQKQAYDQMRRELAITVASGEKITAVNEAVLRIKLCQVACGAVYGPDREVHSMDAAPRLQLLSDILEEADGKVIVFAPLTSVVHLLYREVKRWGYSVEMITGAVGKGARTKILNAFDQEDSDPHVIVADPRCLAHGEDLTRSASTIVWFGPTDNLEVYEQANARIDGPNQKYKMVAIQIVSTPIEREMYKRLDEKRSLQGLVLDFVRGNV